MKTSELRCKDKEFQSQQAHLNIFLPLKKESLCITSKKCGPKMSVSTVVEKWCIAHVLENYMYQLCWHVSASTKLDASHNTSIRQ